MTIFDSAFEIICIQPAAKKYTNNFSETPFDPNYGTSSKAPSSPYAISLRPT